MDPTAVPIAQAHLEPAQTPAEIVLDIEREQQQQYAHDRLHQLEREAGQFPGPVESRKPAPGRDRQRDR